MRSVRQSDDYVDDFKYLAGDDFQTADLTIYAAVSWALSRRPDLGAVLGGTRVRVIFTVPGPGIRQFVAHYYVIDENDDVLLLRARAFAPYSEGEDAS